MVFLAYYDSNEVHYQRDISIRTDNMHVLPWSAGAQVCSSHLTSRHSYFSVEANTLGMAHVLAVYCDNVAPAISLVATVSPTQGPLPPADRDERTPHLFPPGIAFLAPSKFSYVTTSYYDFQKNKYQKNIINNRTLTSSFPSRGEKTPGATPRAALCRQASAPRLVALHPPRTSIPRAAHFRSLFSQCLRYIENGKVMSLAEPKYRSGE